MRFSFSFLLAAIISLSFINLSKAQQQFLVGGQTNVLLDTATLSSVGLDLSSVSTDVIAPGDLGEGSVAFGINSRFDSPATTFAYQTTNLSPFSGSIEHRGSVFFNDDTVEVGDFSIGFDPGRVAGANSGFFVESTTGLEAILFDVETPTTLNAGPGVLEIGANLLVSSEFATVLGNSALSGADVGDAFVAGASAVPEPSSLAVIPLLGLGFLLRRRS